MLRLPATKIDIGSRDLVWHIDRFEQRKAKYELETRARNQLARAYPSVHGGLSRNLACHVQHEPPHQQISVRDTTNNVVVFDEPVPEDMSAFWDNVMAIAGTSATNAEPLPHELEAQNARSSSASISSHHDTALSHSSTDVQRYDQEWQSYRSNGISQDLYNIATTGSELASQNSGSSEASIQLSAAENLEELVQASNVGYDYPSPKTSKSHNFFARFRYPGHDGGEEEDLSRSFSSQLDLDGPNDVAPEIVKPTHLSRNLDAMSGTFEHKDYETMGCMNPYGPQSPMTSLQPNFDTTFDISSTGTGFRTDNEPTLPALPSYRSIDRLRSRSGGLPRSPLYVSQVAASSSPDKYPGAVSSTVNQDELHVPSLLSQPPRRLKNNRLRKEAYLSTQVEKQLQQHPEAYEHEMPMNSLESFATAKEKSDQDLLILSNNGIHSSFSAATLSAISDFINYPHSGANSSPPHYPTQESSPIYAYSPQALPSYTSPRHSIPAATSSPPLPPPFSATRRLMSFDLTGASSSSPHLSASPTRPSPTLGTLGTSSPDPFAGLQNPFRIPSYSIRSTSMANHPSSDTHPISVTPPNTPHRSIRVYNDALPASSQPQNPVGLPRNGLPNMNYHDHGAYTAPVGARASSRRHWGRTGGESPTRADRRPRRYGWSREMVEEQENIQAWLMREERDADGDVEGAGALLALLTTPPRDARGEEVV